MMKYMGFLLLMIGAAGMDSPSIFVSAIMVSAGLIILLIEGKKETVRRRPKHKHRFNRGLEK